MSENKKGWSKFKKICKKFDIFGAKMNFRINSKKEHKSIFGGITTILFSVLSLIYTIHYFKDFVAWKNMNLIFTNKILEGDPFINLTKTQFAFSFGIMFQENYTDATDLMSEYFDFSAYVVRWVGDYNKTFFPIKLKKCTISDFYYVKRELFEKNDLSEMFCPDIDKLDNFILSGIYTDDWFQFLELDINIKSKHLNNISFLVEFMNKNPLLASTFFLDTGINYDNINTPLPSILNYYFSPISPFEYKFTDIYLSTLEFIDDKNLLITDQTSINDTIFDRASEYSLSIQDRKNLLDTDNKFAHGICKFSIKSSSKYFIVRRSYQKIPEFLANISGLISQILFILMFTINYTNRKSAENKIMSDVLKYKGKKNFDINYLTEVFPRNIERRSINNLNINHTKKISDKLTLKSNPKPNDYDENQIYNKNVNLIKENLGEIEIKPSVSIVPKIQNYTNISEDKIENKPDEDNVFHDSSKSNDSHKESIENENDNPPIYPYIINPLRFKHPSIQFSNIEDIQHKKRLSKNTSRLNIPSFTKKKDIEIDKEMTNKLFKLNTIEIILIKLGCCCQRFKKRKRIVKAGEYKFFFYLDVLTYIKKMQEIDILKYLILSADQLYLFNFLSKPSISTNDITSMVYTEFQQEQKRCLTLTREEILRMKECYKTILTQENITNHDKKLINLIDAEIDSIRD